MKKLLTAKILVFFTVIIIGFILQTQKSLAATNGCCSFNIDQDHSYCYSYENKRDGNNLNFTSENCSSVKGTLEDSKICVDLYYSQTDSSITKENDLPVQGVKCIENPKKIAELQKNNQGILSSDCLNVDNSNIEKCLISSFFPNIGLPGGEEASTDPNAVKALLLAKIGTVIGLVLGLVGIIFLIIIIYAGTQWLTADDSEKKVAEAKEYLRNAIIGLIITMFAYGLSYFVFNALAKAS